MTEDLENTTSLFFHGVSLKQIYNSKAKKVVFQLKEVFTHRTQGWSCHLSLTLWKEQDLFYEVNLCSEIKYPSPWPRLEVSALQLPILKESNNFNVQLTADTAIMDGDELLISIPAELHMSSR